MLDAKTQNALYKTHKSRIQGSDIIEIAIPEFTELDEPVGKSNLSLRYLCFDMKTTNGVNVFVDVDNATRSGETVFHVKKEDKSVATTVIKNWIKTHFKCQVTWNDNQQFDAKTYRLDPQSRTLASQLTAIANEGIRPLPATTSEREKVAASSYKCMD
jgi:hypothetical protein